jgi:hypothetical protein
MQLSCTTNYRASRDYYLFFFVAQVEAGDAITGDGHNFHDR